MQIEPTCNAWAWAKHFIGVTISFYGCGFLFVRYYIRRQFCIEKLASSPGHSQFLMIHAKNEKAWLAKSHAPHLGGRGRVVEG